MESLTKPAGDDKSFNHKNGKKVRPFSGVKYKPATITKGTQGRAVENKIDLNKALFSQFKSTEKEKKFQGRDLTE